jgi:hypothetical protein
MAGSRGETGARTCGKVRPQRGNRNVCRNVAAGGAAWAYLGQHPAAPAPAPRRASPAAADGAPACPVRRSDAGTGGRHACFPLQAPRGQDRPHGRGLAALPSLGRCDIPGAVVLASWQGCCTGRRRAQQPALHGVRRSPRRRGAGELRGVLDRRQSAERTRCGPLRLAALQSLAAGRRLGSRACPQGRPAAAGLA